MVTLSWAFQAMAIDNTPPLPDPALQQRYLGLINEFRCMQCQNETLADSNVGLAADLRREIHELILAGKSDEQIRDYLVARYGEFILFKPRFNARTAWLWAAPGVLLLAGLGIAVRIVRQRSRLPITDDDPPGHVSRSMNAFILWAAVCALIAVMLLVWPLLRKREDGNSPQYLWAISAGVVTLVGRRAPVSSLEQLAVAGTTGGRS